MLRKRSGSYIVIHLHRHSLQLPVTAILDVEQGAQLLLHLRKKISAVCRHDPVVSNSAGPPDICGHFPRIVRIMLTGQENDLIVQLPVPGEDLFDLPGAEAMKCLAEQPVIAGTVAVRKSITLLHRYS